LKQLVRRPSVWHEAGMSSKNSQSSRGGGFIIAISTLAGTVAGAALGQLSIGIICGVGFGAGLALLLWLRDRRS
jgi:hypothetical protein